MIIYFLSRRHSDALPDRLHEHRLRADADHQRRCPPDRWRHTSVWEFYLRSIFRDVFQLHHGHGGEQRAADCAGPQLPPQTPGHPQYAHMGQSVLPYNCLK